ncbi:hypothetical protein [Acidovorax sp.]
MLQVQDDGRGIAPERIELDGSGNTVYVPEGSKVPVTRHGNSNDVIER